jgi:hypothetical protein
MHPDELCPDGVVINVNWDALKVGMSFFVPAVNLTMLKKHVQNVARHRLITLKGFERIENQKLGMRFWRVL